MSEEISKKKTILLTGATGLLGSYILKTLLENRHKVYALARSMAKKDAKQRIKDGLKFWDESILDIKVDNLKIVEGDITKENLGLNDNIKTILKDEVEEVFHCAAMTKFNATLNALRRVNVQGTKNLLEFVSKTCSNKISKNINYISTAFVCGTFNGIFAERDFNRNQTFNNNYEQSKFEAESVVRGYIERGIPIRIFRPSILVGEYFSGKTPEFNMFYEPLRLFSLEIFKEVPLDIRTFLNLIPVDLVARAIYVLSIKGDVGKTYHITSPNAFRIEHIIDESSRFFNFNKPKYIELQKYKVKNIKPTAKKMLEVYIPYFNFMALFNSDETKKLLTKYGFIYPPIDVAFLQRLFTFCNYKRFIKIKIMVKS